MNTSKEREVKFMTTLEIILISILGYIAICWISLIIFSRIEKIVDTEEILIFIPFIIFIPLILPIVKIKHKINNKNLSKRYKKYINN